MGLFSLTTSKLPPLPPFLSPWRIAAVERSDQAIRETYFEGDELFTPDYVSSFLGSDETFWKAYAVALDLYLKGE